MPPDAIRSSVVVSICRASGAPRNAIRSTNSRVLGWGNFGAAPNPPQVASKDRRSSAIASDVSSSVSGSIGCLERPRSRDRVDDPAGLSLDVVSPFPPRLFDPLQHLPERRHPVGRFLGEVRAGEERLALRGQEGGQRPPSLAGHRLDRIHVDRVEVGPLLPVDLDRDEVGVQERGRLLVLEGLALHHVAPMTRGVADRQEDRTVLGRRPRQRFLTPGEPVHGVVGVL